MKSLRIDKQLKKLRRKIWMNKTIQIISYMFLLGGIAVFICMLLGHLYGMVYPIQKGMKLLWVFSFMGILAGVCSRPTLHHAATIGDEIGLEDRLKTYLEYINEENPLAACFKEEVEDKLEGFELLKKYNFYIPIKGILLSVVILFLSFGFSFVPSRGWEAAQEKVNINKSLRAEIGKIKEMERKIESEAEDKDDVNHEDFKEIINPLQELRKKLEETFSYKDGALEIVAAQEKIKAYEQVQNRRNRELFSGLFQDLEKSHSAMTSAFSEGNTGEALALLENTSFTEKEQERILHNLNELENRINKEDFKNSLKQMQTQGKEGSLEGKNLINMLEDLKYMQKLQLAQDTVFQLDSMKERTLAKTIEEIDSVNGDYHQANEGNGKRDEMGDGEQTNHGVNEIALGNEGNQSMNQADGVGGSGGRADGEGGRAQEGQVARKENETKLEEKGKQDYLQGIWNENGKLTERKSSQVIEIEGSSQSLSVLQKTFQQEGMDYVTKQEIPLEHRSLVVEYFEKILQ